MSAGISLFFSIFAWRPRGGFFMLSSDTSASGGSLDHLVHLKRASWHEAAKKYGGIEVSEIAQQCK
jgi:hypothetical protein